MKKTIVAFSNPFGYGPTGTVLPLLERIIEQTHDTRIIFAGSPMCMEIMKGVAVEKVLIDERDEASVYDYIKTIQEAHVIGSQNRFCVRASKRLGVPNAFIDILAWFWNEIPEDHLLADEIFWIKLPGIEAKFGHEKAHLVSAIITAPTILPRKEKKLVVHIGGAKYPLIKQLPLRYLNLLAKGLNMLMERDGSFDEILFVGGSEAVAYMKSLVRAGNIILTSLPKNAFINECASASHILTTAGVSSTLESFSMNIPTSFLLPLNLSQVVLADLLKKWGAYPQGMIWDDYIITRNDLRYLSEREALEEIDSYAGEAGGNSDLSGKFANDFCRIAEMIPDNTGQKALIGRIGCDGDKEIAEVLIKKWNLI